MALQDFIPMLLRVASGLQLMFAVAHAFGHSTVPSRGGEENAVVEKMKAFTFDVMGSTRSHWEFYEGYSIFLVVDLVCFGALKAILFLVIDLI